MKDIIVALLLTAFAYGQNCSHGTMGLTGLNGYAPCNLQTFTTQTYTETATYEDKCYNTNYSPATVYMDVSSSLARTGQCVESASNPPCGGSGQPACNKVVWTCNPLFTSQETDATGPNDYNRFYNRGWNYDLADYYPNCVQGLFNQDMRQCAGITCHPSPIIVDTDGTGFHLTSAEDGVVFDIMADGTAIKVAWTAPGSRTAFLALDRNHNGRIDDGSELFGNHTEQVTSPNPNGYLALAEFDKPENGGNGDGIIDWHDAVFSELRLWIDENHDGISQPEELHSLSELGVFSIGLKYKRESFTDQFGNLFRYRGVLNPNPLDGTSRDGRYTYDVFFAIPKSLSARAETKKNQPSILQQTNSDLLKESLK